MENLEKPLAEPIPSTKAVVLEYKIAESESTALESVFNKLFEMVEKELSS